MNVFFLKKRRCHPKGISKD